MGSVAPHAGARRWIRAVAAVVVGLLISVALVHWVVPLLRNPNMVELCGRSFQKGDEPIDQASVDAFGPLHAVGESRRGDTLYTSNRAWPNGGCGEPMPTVLVSKANATQWFTWSLRGGP